MSADPISAVVAEWKDNAKLCKQASGGAICIVGKEKEISRQEVCVNWKILDPVIKHLGI